MYINSNVSHNRAEHSIHLPWTMVNGANIRCVTLCIAYCDYQKAMLRLLHIFRVIMILGATLCTTTLARSLYESNEFVMYTHYVPLSLPLCSVFVHKFQALDKQNESKNSKKLFFIHQCTALAKRAREAFWTRNRGKKTH